MLIRILVAGLLALALALPVSASPWLPLAQSGRLTDGIWQSQGYGRLLVLQDGAPTIYHSAGPFCYPDPEPTAAADETYRSVTAMGRDRIAFRAAPGATHYVFDRVATLPPACLSTHHWTPADIGRLVAATFADLYPGFGMRGRTEQALSDALVALPPDTSETLLYETLTAALARLDDAHVGLEAKVAGGERSFEGGEAATIRAVRDDAALGADPAERERTWSQTYREGIVGLLDGGGHHVANRRVLWGRIGNVGYLNIVTMGAFDRGAAPDDTAALDAALDQAMAAFRGLPGVIVDVTNNRGGYDAVGLRIAGRFADRGAVAFTKRAVGAAVPVQAFHVEPSDRPRYVGPVTLLTSDITVSAAETFTLAMRALPNVKHVGSRTRGALSDQLVKPLPNGWTLSLPAEIYQDGEGGLFEGLGIAPETQLAPFAPSHSAVLSQLAQTMVAQGR